MSKRKTAKPDGPAYLEDEYRYQAGKRSHWSAETGLPSAAWSGDRDALRKCAGMAMVMVEGMPARADLAGVREWLCCSLSAVYAGQSPDEAFGWKRDRPGPKREFATIRKQWLIGQHMAGLVAELMAAGTEREAAIDQAAKIVAKSCAIKPYTARDYFLKFKEPEGGEE